MKFQLVISRKKLQKMKKIIFHKRKNVKSTSKSNFYFTKKYYNFLYNFRSPAQDEWESNRPESEERSSRGGGYDGPAGMDPEGLIDSNWNEVCENFDDMNLKEELLRGIYAYGFEKPSAIQQRAIVPCVKGHDVIAQAQSGTGKTATFSISILQQIDTKNASCQALVLAPTRELAQQIQKVVMALGDYMGAQCHACIGGTSVREDMMKLNNGVHIVVGKLSILP